MKNEDSVEEIFTIGDLITPIFPNVMIMRLDEREYLRLNKGETCIVLGFEGKKLMILHEGCQWWVQGFAVERVSSIYE